MHCGLVCRQHQDITQEPTGAGRLVDPSQRRIREGGPTHRYPRKNTQLPWDGHRLYSPGQS